MILLTVYSLWNKVLNIVIDFSKNLLQFRNNTNVGYFWTKKTLIMKVIIKDIYMPSNDTIKFEKSIEFGGIV